MTSSKNKHRAIFGAKPTYRREVTRLGENQTDIADVRLKNDRRDLTGVGGEGRGEGSRIVERKNNRFARKRRRNARTVGIAVRERARAGFDQERIGVPVITAGKLDDLVALRETPGQPDGGHRGFGPAAGHADFLNRRHEARNQLSHFDLERIGRAKRRASLERRGDRGFDARVVVPVNGGAPRADEINQLAIVGRRERSALRRLDVKRRAADGAKSTDRGIDSAGNEFESAIEERFGNGHSDAIVVIPNVGRVDAETAKFAGAGRAQAARAAILREIL